MAQKSRARSVIREAATILALTLFVFVAVQAFIGQPFEVRQLSMLPGFKEGDLLLIDKIATAADDYARGDIVVLFEQADMRGIPLIKRVIAVPGERVTIRDGAIFVGETRLIEAYTAGDPTIPRCVSSEWLIPERHVFVLGDNRGDSFDSRCFGPVAVNQIVGRAIFRYWPLDRLTFVPRPVY